MGRYLPVQDVTEVLKTHHKAQTDEQSRIFQNFLNSIFSLRQGSTKFTYTKLIEYGVNIDHNSGIVNKLVNILN